MCWKISLELVNLTKKQGVCLGYTLCDIRAGSGGPGRYAYFGTTYLYLKNTPEMRNKNLISLHEGVSFSSCLRISFFSVNFNFQIKLSVMNIWYTKWFEGFPQSCGYVFSKLFDKWTRYLHVNLCFVVVLTQEHQLKIKMLIRLLLNGYFKVLTIL